MIINHNLKDLLKITRNMSTLQRIKFIDKLNKEEKYIRKMERTLQKGSNIATKRSTPKKWNFNNKDVFN